MKPTRPSTPPRTASSPARPTTIVLIEDDARLADQLRPQLLRSGFDCVWAATAEAGRRSLETLSPDLVLLDLNLPDRSGFDVLEEVRTNNQVPVIVLTARLQGQDKVRALDLGADDYVTKPFWPEELSARIRAVLRRRTPWERPHDTLVVGEVSIDTEARRVHTPEGEIGLTPTEYDLLVYLTERVGRAVHREHLISQVIRGDDSDVEALQAHMSRLRRKLGRRGRYVKTVRGVGYRLEIQK